MNPTLFIGHGSPMNALETNSFTREWQRVAQDIPKPKVILVISAHWVTRGTYITGAGRLETIHDFGGFPQALFDFQYPAKGHPTLAAEIADTLGITVDPHRGLDHGSWSVLTHMYPEADIPVLQLSLDFAKSPQEHFEFAQKLSYLRDQSVLILSTGNIIHNLGLIQWNDTLKYPWAVEFDNLIADSLKSKDFNSIITYQKYGQMATNSVPTPEHFLPLLYTIGSSYPADKIEIFNQQVMMGALSMTSVLNS
jgi:4,5-DOPA dioxygenase extradiol